MDILIYAVIAAILVYRLYTVLGQKDGDNARQRPNPFAYKPDNNKGKEDLLALPLAQPKVKPAAQQDNKLVQLYPQAQAVAVEPASDSLAGAIHAIQKADPSFDERSFLKGARIAFEMIVRAFASGDRTALKNLLTPVLYTAFEAAISDRELKGERWEMKTIHVRDMDLVAAKMDGTHATLTVQCISEQSKMIYNREGVVSFDPGREVERLTDIWTFRRDTKSGNPNWQLVETKSV